MTEMENMSRVSDSGSSSSIEQQLRGLDFRESLLTKLSKSLSIRANFVSSNISKEIAFQVQAMRGKKEWTQQQLADELGTNQNSVYRLENPNYGKQTISTLKKVAKIFDVALVVRFVPFSQLLDWVSAIPHVDAGLNENSLAVARFDEEVSINGKLCRNEEKADEVELGALAEPGTDTQAQKSRHSLEGSSVNHPPGPFGGLEGQSPHI